MTWGFAQCHCQEKANDNDSKQSCGEKKKKKSLSSSRREKALKRLTTDATKAPHSWLAPHPPPKSLPSPFCLERFSGKKQ
jgi:hypothetical protein